MTPVIEIIIVGNEILSGRTRDLNARYMIDALGKHGYSVSRVTVVGDVMDELTGVFRDVATRADVGLVSGGLGPTSDDMTVDALACAFDRELETDKTVLAHIERIFRKRGRTMSESNRKQALVPVGGDSIGNPIGTAPGVRMKDGRCTFYLMPGVPFELEGMFVRSVLPELTTSYTAAPVERTELCVTGISESEVYDRISHLPGARDALAYYPGPHGIELAIKTTPDSPMAAGQLKKEISDILGDVVFAEEKKTLEESVAELLFETGLTVSVAESCTGGLIASRLTDVAGSSRYLLAGVVAYANEAKRDLLGVDMSLIERNGAVSAPVAAAMAEGIRTKTGADIGISTTGIAGPTGGTPEKPVGLMFTAISTQSGTETKKLQFVEDRLINKMRMSQSVLNELRLHIQRRR